MFSSAEAQTKKVTLWTVSCCHQDSGENPSFLFIEKMYLSFLKELCGMIAILAFVLPEEFLFLLVLDGEIKQFISDACE